MNKCRSVIWNYFTINKDDSDIAICVICQCNIRRGKSCKEYSTSPLITHLRTKHAEKYKEFDAQQQTIIFPGPSSATKSVNSLFAEQTKKQPTLVDCLESKKPFDSNHPRAKEITKQIAQMIAVDIQPMSVVENIGFRRLIQFMEPRYTLLSRQYMSEFVIPSLYQEAKSKLSALLLQDGENLFSFTTDIWTSENSSCSFISLTVHFVNSSFAFKNYMLCNKALTELHTGETIATTLRSCLTEWNILFEKISCFITDNGANVKKGINILEADNKFCAAHTLQLVVNAALTCNATLIGCIGTVRKIVAHFRHSTSASDELKKIQLELGLPPHKLLQDVATRWNSTYYMLDRIYEQQKAVIMFSAMHPMPKCLTQEQWSLIQKIIKIFRPLEEITTSWSADDCSISLVIPGYHLLKRCFSDLASEIEADENHDIIEQVLATLSQAIDRRFALISRDTDYMLATFLDPRFKSLFLDNASIAALKQTLNTKYDVQPKDKQPQLSEPPVKRSRVSSIWDGMNLLEKNQMQTSTFHSRDGCQGQLDREIDLFLNSSKIGRECDPFNWWKMNSDKFPALSKAARKYLGIPATSVRSERMFSSAHDIISEKRNRLRSHKAEMLLFLKCNLPVLNFDCSQ